MQPLSYQLAKESCWVTCMINGIRIVEHKDRISTEIYLLLHSLLQDDGVCYNPEFMNAIGELADITNLTLEIHIEDQVGVAVSNLHFNNQVAICDVNDGDHSILLKNRVDDWFEGFDPYWYNEERSGNPLLNFPKGNCNVNLKIHRRHLLAQSVNEYRRRRGMEYHTGEISTRCLIVIKKPS